jgi:hypothetical protein
MAIPLFPGSSAPWTVSPFQLRILVRVRVTLRLAVYRQLVRLGGKPLETHDQQLSLQLNSCFHRPYVILSDERMGLQFTVAAGPHQRSHSQVRLLRDLWPHFTVSNSRLPQPGGPGPRIYILQKQGCPQALGSLFVASYYSQGYGGGIRPYLHETNCCFNWFSYEPFARTEYKTPFPKIPLMLHTYPLPRERVYRAFA